MAVLLGRKARFVVLFKLLIILVFTLTFGFLPPAIADEQDPIIATINGENILRSHLDEARQLLPKNYQAVPIEQIFPALVDSIIDTKLAAADARAKKLHKKKDFQSRMRRIEDQLLQRVILEQVMTRAVSDAEVKQRYDDMARNLADDKEIRARHILVKTEDEAKSIINELDAGVAFSKLAKSRSTGPSGPSGGDLGFFKKGQMVPSFEKAAFALIPGEVTSKPVKTEFGYHIIKVEENRKVEVPSFKSVAEQLRGEISQKRGSAYVEALWKGARVVRFNLDGKLLETKTISPDTK